MTKYRDEPILTSDIKLIHWLGLDHFKPEQALTSHFVSTKTLFFIRLLWTTYMTAVIWIDIIYTLLTGEFRHFLVYFTDLTSIGLYAYLMTTCIHHAKYLQSKRPDSFLNQAAVLNYLYVYLYHTIITYNILTPVVFWALLAKERLFEAHLPVIECWISISLHAVTMMMMVMEIMLSRMVIQIRMILLVFGTVLLYLGMVFIVFAM
ncbi:hypothetical protein CU098_009619 [Rhizopus stolonifer]|uniref:Uncharacterized protein n=1 Tax=Rhizopus stolonifer TaxID=4846 RepID=A0A367KNV2_RHIST|nr:hypothetical protein CU098_009619 [Rhizopus stolonifer]